MPSPAPARLSLHSAARLYSAALPVRNPRRSYPHSFSKLRLLHLLLIMALVFPDLTVFARGSSPAAAIPVAEMSGLPKSSRGPVEAPESSPKSLYEDGQAGEPRVQVQTAPPAVQRPPLPAGEPGASLSIPARETIAVTTPMTLTLKAEPQVAIPGGSLAVSWQIDGWQGKPETLTLLAYLPSGFTPLGLDFKPEAGALPLQLTSPSGQVKLAVSKDAAGPFTLSARLLDGEQLLDVDELPLDDTGLTSVSKSGGQAFGLEGMVRVIFPTVTDGVALDVRVRQSFAGGFLPSALSRRPFEILARSQTDGQKVTVFKQPLTIEVAIPDGEQWTTINYYDVKSSSWLPLPTVIDPKAGVLRALTDHLTHFDVDVDNWQAARLPSLDASQVSPYTGAASYSFPLWTPPGPGGLQPGLSLSYASQVVEDAIPSQTQASWVGMGWSLDVGSIRRDMHGTMDNDLDDAFSISLNGISGRVLKDASGYYHTTDESFYKIQWDTANDIWYVWDKAGTKYTFGKDNSSRARYPGFDWNCSHPRENYPVTWQWSLAEITTIYQQTLSFSYFKESMLTADPCDSSLKSSTDMAIYPSQITYPHGHYLVKFDPEARHDQKNRWLTDFGRTFFQQSRLDKVRIENDGVTVRTYDLSYEAVIFPNFTWEQGGQTFSLSRIQETGLSGDASLPATTFAYTDGMHLTQVDNGYGGKTVFSYESSPWHEASGSTDWTSEWTFNSTTGDCSEWYNGACDTNNRLRVNAYVEYTAPIDSLQHGRWYHLETTLTGSGGTARVGLNYGGTSYQYSPSYTLYNGLHIAWDVFVPLAATQLKVRIECGSCKSEDFKLKRLLTQYRVLSRTLQDESTGTTQADTFSYRYDEPATNDADHSTAVATTSGDLYRYDQAFSEPRGHAKVTEYGPDGHVNDVWFYQDDALRGRASFSLSRTETFTDTFEAGYDSTTWTKINAATLDPVSVERKRGDQALKLASDASWRGVRRSWYPLGDGEAAIAQFMIGASAESVLALATSDGKRWGVYVKSNGTTVAQVNDGSGFSEPKTLFSSAQFKRNTWYTLILIADDQQFYMGMWERDNPGANNFYQQSLPSGLSWGFMHQVSGGSAWLDEVAEGQIYRLTTDTYASDAPATPYAPPSAEMKIYWPRQLTAGSLAFEGDAQWVGTLTQLEYNASEQNGSQYGNQTRAVESRWDGSAWQRYRAAVTWYYPNSGPYLTGLPAATSRYQCPSNLCDYEAADLLNSQLSLYDGAASYTTPPSAGMLTGRRTLIRFQGASFTDPRYSDVAFGYDTWGNRTTVTKYTDEGTAGALATSEAQTTTTGYDPTYHTYAVSETDALGHTTTWVYNYQLGVPTSETDPNSAATQAIYDNFGRMRTLARPYDSESSPTLQIDYYDAQAPLMVVLQQKIAAGQFSTLRKFYNGLGQLVQEQAAGAVTHEGTRDIVVDTSYDAYGQVVRRSVPYTVATGSGYRTPDIYQAKTQTTYDLLGRVSAVTATDGTQAATAYLDLETRVTDALGHTTRTLLDEWGRAVQVIPPAGPAMVYNYNALDALTSAVQGGSATTALAYDLAGRKLSQDDPDLGHWSYTYDAAGNLETQTDARSCTTSFTYDLLNRLTGKTYSGACQGAQAVSFTFDQGTNAIGRRTAMSDASGNTAWVYDLRGRLTQETKAVDGSGTFLTRWAYFSDDQVQTQWYPGGADGEQGEAVTYTYHPQGALNSVTGDDPYVQSTSYDAAGRPRFRVYKPEVLGSEFDYYAWTSQGGRLQRIQSGHPVNNISTHQFLEYTYDEVGNITQIVDYRAGGTQTQAFQYDAAGRLWTAQASGGTGGTYDLETYTYDSLGRLSGLPFMGAYTYDSTHRHAVASTDAGLSFQYDADGNMTGRSLRGNTYTLAYDAENRLAAVSGGGGGTPNTTYVYDGDGKLVKELASYQDLAAGIAPTSDTGLYQAQAATDGDAWADSGMGTSGQFAYTSSGPHYLQIDLGRVYPVDQVKVWHYAGDGRTYHGTKIEVSRDCLTYQAVFDSAVSGEYAESQAGKPVSFSSRGVKCVRDWLNGNTSNGGNHWVEIEVWGEGGATTYIGDYFEMVSAAAVPTQPPATTPTPTPTPTGTPAPTATSTPTPIPTFQVQEAEAGVLAGGFEVGSDPSASGGQYVFVPQGFGQRGDVPNENRVTYTFTLATAGTYRIQGWVYGNDGDTMTDSFWVQVDGEPTGGYLWDITYGTSYTPDYVSHRNGSDPVEVSLMAGAHTVEVSLRDDGVRLDKIGLEQVSGPSPTATPTPTATATATSSGSCSGLAREAEAGTLNGAFAVESDPAASGGQYIRSTTEFMQIEGNTNTASYCFTVSSAGIYRVKGWVYAADPYSDSFFVRVDGQPTSGYRWFFDQNTSYDPDYVNDIGVQDPLEVSLSAGQHTVTVYVREENARLDKVELEWVSGGMRSSGGRMNLLKAPLKLAPNRLTKGPALGRAHSPAYTIIPDGATYRSYYSAGAQRVAVRERTATTNTLSYLLSDHLGSTHVTADSSGNVRGVLRYKPWGGLRYNSGDPKTDYRYTGQRADSVGLYFYRSRFFDSSLGRFVQPDSIVPNPNDPASWDRMAYTRNNPLNYSDPDGHWPIPNPIIPVLKLINWYTGKDVGYTGSGLGHGPRQLIGSLLGYQNNDSVENLTGMVAHSLLQYKSVNISGPGLEKLEQDPGLQEFENYLIDKAHNDSRYGTAGFSFVGKDDISFGGNRSPGNLSEFLKVGSHETTWMLRWTTVHANVSVSEQGSTTISYSTTDILNLRPAQERSGAYNLITGALGTLYHDVLGGNDRMKVRANWSVAR